MSARQLVCDSEFGYIADMVVPPDLVDHEYTSLVHLSFCISFAFLFRSPSVPRFHSFNSPGKGPDGLFWRWPGGGPDCSCCPHRSRIREDVSIFQSLLYWAWAATPVLYLYLFSFHSTVLLPSQISSLMDVALDKSSYGESVLRSLRAK